MSEVCPNCGHTLKEFIVWDKPWGVGEMYVIHRIAACEECGYPLRSMNVMKLVDLEKARLVRDER